MSNFTESMGFKSTVAIIAAGAICFVCKEALDHMDSEPYTATIVSKEYQAAQSSSGYVAGKNGGYVADIKRCAELEAASK